MTPCVFVWVRTPRHKRFARPVPFRKSYLHNDFVRALKSYSDPGARVNLAPQHSPKQDEYRCRGMFARVAGLPLTSTVTRPARRVTGFGVLRGIPAAESQVVLTLLSRVKIENRLRNDRVQT